MGTKCFNMYSTDDSLSIYKPASQGGSKNIYIGGNDETAPLKIVGNKVFINGVEYIPPAAAATIVDAAATIALTQPVITAITVPVTSQGSGYSTTTPPTVVFNNGVPPVGGTLATATVLSTGITAGKIITVTLNSPGSGYTTPPTITFTGGGGGTGAAAIATLTPPAPTLTLTSPITVTERGSGYKSAPTVVFNAGVPPVGGTLATATAALGTAVGTTDKVISVTLTSPGAGYTSAPAITFTGGR